MYFNLTLCWCKDLKQTLFGYTLFCLECDGHRLRPLKILSCVKSTIAGCERRLSSEYLGSCKSCRLVIYL